MSQKPLCQFPELSVKRKKAILLMVIPLNFLAILSSLAIKTDPTKFYMC